MGNCCGAPMPEPDDRLKKTMKTFLLRKADLKAFWRLFTKYDSDRSGTIDTVEFYEMVQEQPSVFCDAIFGLIETRQEHVLDFSEFVQAVSTYIMFSKKDVLRFAFYIFDKDKNGTIEREELHALVGILHDNAVDGVIQLALADFDTDNDGRIDFAEFQQMHAKHPQILFPAFRLQANMMMFTLGQPFWLAKRGVLADERERDAKRRAEAKARELKQKKAMQMAEVERRMGTCQYFCCFWKRREFLKDMMRAQMIQERQETDQAERKRQAEADAQEGSDYDSSADDGDKYHVDVEFEKAKRMQRKQKQRENLQKRTYGYERPDMDLDRDRRERRRDVRGTTHKFERVREKDRFITQEERAQQHKARRKRKESAKREGSSRRVSPIKYAR